jgi:hypothetical protein
VLEPEVIVYIGNPLELEGDWIGEVGVRGLFKRVERRGNGVAAEGAVLYLISDYEAQL